MNPLKKLHLGPGEQVILIVIGVLALIVLTGNHQTILNALYSPTAAIIPIIMLVEYLILKGSDRSVIYRRELDLAREKRRDDLLALRTMENELVDLRARIDSDMKQPDNQALLQETAAHARSRVEQMLTLLRGRI